MLLFLHGKKPSWWNASEASLVRALVSLTREGPVCLSFLKNYIIIVKQSNFMIGEFFV